MASQAGKQVKVPAEPESLEIDLSRTAVTVVDMQNTFVRRGGIFDLAGFDISTTEKIIKPCQAVAKLAREKGIKVIYTQMAYSPDLADSGGQESPLRHAFSLGPTKTQEATILNVRTTFGWVTTSKNLLNVISSA